MPTDPTNATPTIEELASKADALTDDVLDLDRSLHQMESDERKRLRTEERLRAAKRGLMAALAAETPREFVLACSQACSMIVADAGAKALVKSFRKTVGALADATQELDPMMVVDLFESLGLKGERLEALRTAAQTMKGAAAGAVAPCGAGKCPGGACPAQACESPADHAGAPAEVVLRPVVMASEYADRTEVRVVLGGCERENVQLTKSATGYFVEAKTNAGVTFRGPVTTFRGPVTSFIAAQCAAGVTWDADGCELVLTFPRVAVEEVPIEAPVTDAPPAVE